ncbi:SsgA family sporulation/cell division regulator [Streptomyces smyrnaeus]|uniref:SsgA family sporulation/cell division regulator n=1 Tax=Streptomyces TaxID=1883 RepID=UPI000C183254|nr:MULTISPECIES: SsgA family sporulation/cell division regulator [unclassified Streptomyces]MBQ0862863.1 SsgA family sporulation/cell division regulator [Streptomyces sp. RK75]MBQ1122580.1 SsgA family sporulation/cell division regulator [Streptomyces sp. B15]MBQ1162971.1 SsgA family sporulation/cell division regulator [Streptomyces sp. A73]
MHTVVEREVEMRLVLSPERSVAVPARFSYRTDDPYAVHMTFHIYSEKPVDWTFARELLVKGVTQPSGDGDVRVWPTCVAGRKMLCLALSSPNGDALLETPSDVVAAWLARTLHAVPQGSESEALGLDEQLIELLER